MSRRRPPVQTLSAAEARALVLRSQGLGDDLAPFGTGKAGTLSAVEHLGYVQIDSISVLQRAHHHVLRSRVPDYQPAHLHELQSEDAAVFEYWSHAASFLLTRDWRFSLPMMRKFRAELHWSDETPEMRSAMRRMLGRIRRTGPLRVSEVEGTGLVAGGWTTDAMGKIERRALHELAMRGDIMVRSRQGFQKIFDLPARVLPPGTETKLPTKREAAEFHVRQTLRAQGLGRVPEFYYLRGAEQKSAILAALKALIAVGEVVELRVEGDAKTPVFTLGESLALTAPLQARRLHFLSPFDNLVIQRKRLKTLFGFDYTVEIYVPPAKRRYGYFVLPILWGDRFVGRMDAKAFRAECKLVIHNLVFEPGFAEWTEFAPAFRSGLEEFAHFQECYRWEIAKVEPASFTLREGG